MVLLLIILSFLGKSNRENIFNKHSLLSASTAYVLKLYAQKLAISSIIYRLGSYVSVLQISENLLQVSVEEK